MPTIDTPKLSLSTDKRNEKKKVKSPTEQESTKSILKNSTRFIPTHKISSNNFGLDIDSTNPHTPPTSSIQNLKNKIKKPNKNDDGDEEEIKRSPRKRRRETRVVFGNDQMNTGKDGFLEDEYYSQ